MSTKPWLTWRRHALPLHEPSRPEVNHTETEVYGSLPDVGVWNETNGSWALQVQGSLWGAFKLFWRYGWDLVRVSRHANAVKSSLQAMYKQQRENPCRPYCYSVEDMLQKTGLDYWAGRSFSELGYKPQFVAECVDPIARTIYSRGSSAVNGYCGLAAVIAADGSGLYSCPLGNSRLVAKLLELSAADVCFNHTVKSVTRREEKVRSWTIVADTPQGSTESMAFDAVVLACPWETLADGISWPDGVLGPRRVYRPMIVTLVAGRPALANGLVPQNILTCGAGGYDGTFYSMGVVAAHEGSGQDVWKIFSASTLTCQELSSLFRPGYHVLVSHPWERCFPELAPQERYPPMRLEQGLYFANAMEALAPSMEAAAWCGKNVALMLAEEL
eukprot:TRINITY_DN74964_c0_g1_i1.p1 TRINITY_DN74964_c0_g1~~TRINITY_DN74964_c0_g1_i1.p1  ORF type:complete len:387 (+),score=23.49 TRINITY_DN74964_c0_g1_i1:92-1252(+)